MATKSIKKKRKNPPSDRAAGIFGRADLDSADVDWKKMTLVGGGLIAAGLTVAWLVKVLDKPTPKKTNYGIVVTAQCSDYTITDPLVLKTRLRDAVKRAGQKDNTDPFTITAAYLTQSGIGCTSYPSVPRNPGEARLFYEVFSMVTAIMQDTNQLSQPQRQIFDTMAQTWAASHGAFPQDPIIFDDEEVTPDPPPFA